MSELNPIQKKRLMTLNIGPHHPATHGVLRLRTLLDGETIVDVEPIIGYLHRSSEKIGEMATYLQFLPYTDRMDYLAAIFNNLTVCKACEELGDIEVPERAQVLRVFAMELNRITSHLLWLGTFAIDVGALTPFFWCFREREKGLAILERLTGTRITYTYGRFGGVKWDADAKCLRMAKQWMDELPQALDELDNLLKENDIWRARLKDVGHISPEQVKDWALSGPIARASGVGLDLRKAEPWTGYETYDFDVPVRDEGDCYARYLVRVEEMRESRNIILQTIERLGEVSGPIVAPSVGEGAKQLRFKPPAGEIYSRLEGPRGELGCYIASDGSNRPHRIKIRAPSFTNVAVLPEIAKGGVIPDLIATMGSIDFVLGDIDR